MDVENTNVEISATRGANRWLEGREQSTTSTNYKGSSERAKGWFVCDLSEGAASEIGCRFFFCELGLSFARNRARTVYAGFFYHFFRIPWL